MDALTSGRFAPAHPACEANSPQANTAPLLRYRGVAYRHSAPAAPVRTGPPRLVYRGVAHDGTRSQAAPAPRRGEMHYRGVIY